MIFVPKLLAFAIILVAGYFIARALGKLIDRALERMGVERWVERGGIKEALRTSGYHVSTILGKIAFYTMFLFVLQLAFGVFGPNPVSDLLTRFIAFLPNIFVAILIAVISLSIAAAVREIVRASLGGLGYGKTIANFAWIAIVMVGMFAALDQLQIAPRIVDGLFYGMLAIVCGSAIIAIGGGGIAPMRTLWERALGKVQEEAPKVREQVQASQNSMERQTADATGPRML